MDQRYADDPILTGFLAGEDDAVHHVQGWVDGVVHLGRWRFKDPEAVSQEIVMRLLEIVRSGRYARRSSFKTFAFAVAKYTCVDLFRSERLRARVESPGTGQIDMAPAQDSASQPLRVIEEREDLELLRYILQGLPEQCRQLWAWVYGEGLTAVDVGRRIGASAGTVRVRVHRCLQKARDLAYGYARGPGLFPAGPRR